MVDVIITPRALLRSVISEVARRHMIAPELIEGRSQKREVMSARAAVARGLLARGVSEQRIAHMMHTDVATVQMFLGKRKTRKPITKEDGHGEEDGSEGSCASSAA